MYWPINRQLAAELTINWALSPRLSCWQCRNPNGMAIAVIALEQARYLTAMRGASSQGGCWFSSPARLPVNWQDLMSWRCDRMSANRPKALAVIGCTDAPLASTWPRSLFADPKPSLAASARTRIRRFFASIDGRGAKIRAGTDGPGSHRKSRFTTRFGMIQLSGC